MSSDNISRHDLQVKFDPNSTGVIVVWNHEREDLDTLPIVRKAVLAWAVTADRLVPVFPDTKDSELLRSPLLPAQSRTFVVFVEINASLIELGVETPGASHPDWDELAHLVVERELSKEQS